MGARRPDARQQTRAAPATEAGASAAGWWDNFGKFRSVFFSPSMNACRALVGPAERGVGSGALRAAWLAWAYGGRSRCSGILRCKAAHCARIPSGCTMSLRAPGRRRRNACRRQSSWRTAGRRRRLTAPRVGARLHHATHPATRQCQTLGGQGLQAALQRLHGGLWKLLWKLHVGASDGRPAWAASRPCVLRWAG